MKSHEQRVRDATAAFLDYTKSWYCGIDSSKVSDHHWKAAIHEALEAADRPVWPVDGSLDVVWNRDTSNVTDREMARDRLRDAMLADPIIKAAIEMRHVVLSAVGPVGGDDARAVQAVIDAVDEAGL